MAKFGEEYLLHSLEINKFFKLSVSSSNNEYFVNAGKNSIVKIENHKNNHTWTLKHPHVFTCPVVYHDEFLYCAMDNKVLLVWSVNEEDLKAARKVEFQDSIFAIIPAFGKQALILFNSGKYILIEGYNSETKLSEFSFHKDETLLWADASILNEDIIVFCLTQSKETNKYIIYKFIISEDHKLMSEYSFNIPYSTVNLSTWCLNKNNFSFIYMCSNGFIQQCRVNDSKELTLLSLKDVENNTIIALDSIDSDHIVIARGRLKLKECVLEIWDTKFTILKARKVLKSLNLENLQIAVQKNNIFLCVNKDLICVPFSIEQSTLAAAVGKSVTDSTLPQEFSWDAKGQLQEIPKIEPELMDTSESKDESDPIELIAHKLLNQKSQYLMYIPESELAKLLHLALKCHKKEESKKYTKKEAYIILNIVFSASFNDIFLVKYLKKMNLDETLIALELLLSYLNYTIDLPECITDKPSDLQIFNWICLIIQSHMEALLFSKDKKSKSLLNKLEKVISSKMEEYEDFESILNYFSVLQKKTVLPQKCSEKYCIETLEI